MKLLTKNNSLREINFFGVLFCLCYLFIFYASLLALKFSRQWQVEHARTTLLDIPFNFFTLLIFLIILAILYGLLLRYLKNKEISKCQFRRLILFFIIFQLILLVSFPFFSSDIADYITTGSAITELKINPYLTPVAAVNPQAAAYNGWSIITTAYGPVANLLNSFLAVFRLPFAANLFLFRLVTILFNIGCALLVYLIVGRLKPQMKYLAFAIFAWNPLILLESAANGHNDIILAFFVLLAFWFALQKKLLPAMAALAAACLIKYSPVVLIPLFIAYFINLNDGVKQKIKTFAKSAAVILGLVLITFLPFIGKGLFHGLTQHNQFFSLDLYRGGLAAVIILILISLVEAGVIDKLNFFSQIITVIILSAAYFLVLRKKIDSPQRLISAGALIIFILLLASPFVVHSWYYLWLLPLVILWNVLYKKRFDFSLLFFLTLLALVIYSYANVISTLVVGLICLLWEIAAYIFRTNYKHQKTSPAPVDTTNSD
ncbi:MAG: glycosyltransferase 87 family protein [Patescibacteria group bacterium]|jgi:hypothetical protein